MDSVLNLSKKEIDARLMHNCSKIINIYFLCTSETLDFILKLHEGEEWIFYQSYFEQWKLMGFDWWDLKQLRKSYLNFLYIIFDPQEYTRSKKANNQQEITTVAKNCVSLGILEYALSLMKDTDDDENRLLDFFEFQKNKFDENPSIDLNLLTTNPSAERMITQMSNLIRLNIGKNIPQKVADILSTLETDQGVVHVAEWEWEAKFTLTDDIQFKSKHLNARKFNGEWFVELNLSETAPLKSKIGNSIQIFQSPIDKSAEGFQLFWNKEIYPEKVDDSVSKVLRNRMFDTEADCDDPASSDEDEENEEGEE
jgi:hypothetical protein